MNLKALREMLRRDVMEICRELNREPLESYTNEFRRRGIIKRRQELFAWESDMTQKILQELKDGKKRFILSIKGMWHGKKSRIWVIASVAKNHELIRFREEKLSDIGEQMTLFNEMSDIIEKRTGQPQFKWDMKILDSVRKQIGSNGHPPAPLTE
jgi:hypothetical protein